MATKFCRYTPNTVSAMGKIAIVMAVPIFAICNCKWFLFGTPEPSELLASITLAFLKLMAIAISHCLKNLESRFAAKGRIECSMKSWGSIQAHGHRKKHTYCFWNRPSSIGLWKLV
jgi:hypothetical protein